MTLLVIRVVFSFLAVFAFASDCSFAVRSDLSSVVAFFDLEDGATSSLLCDMALDLWWFYIDR